MKTQALKQALDQYGFDAAFGGARRDEEKSRAKERVFSIPLGAASLGSRSSSGRSSGASTTRASGRAKASGCFRCRTGPSSTSGSTSTSRTFRSCRCTSRKERPVVQRDGTLDHGGRRAHAARAGRDSPSMRTRAVPHARLLSADRRDRERGDDAAGDHPGDAADHGSSERQGRVIDHDQSASMEKKKQEGYF